MAALLRTLSAQQSRRFSRVLQYQHQLTLPLLSTFSRKHQSQADKHAQHQQRKTRNVKGLGFACVGALLGGFGGVGLALNYYRKQANSPAALCSGEKIAIREAGDRVRGLPEYSLEEIAGHNSEDTGIWMAYRDGVYDVTDFVEQHPGGTDNIMLAAGQFLDPYWAVYTQHHQETVHELLEEMRIGNLNAADIEKRPKLNPGGVYGNDPPCSSLMIIHADGPSLAETPLNLLRNVFLTPNEIFFVANHLPVPNIDPESYVLEVRGEGMKPTQLSLQDIKTKFPQHKLTATLQCAGNRRYDMAKVKDVSCQPHWKGGAIGTAEWTGVLLRDVLLYCGLKDGDSAVQHVHLEGLDENPLTGERYGASIPVSNAMSSQGDCLLAYEMNGVELPQSHGYPIRAVIPGSIGARSVKWLGHIVASTKEYGGFWQQQDFKTFCPSFDWDKVDFSSTPAIQEWPVQSLICSPQDGSTLDSSEEVTLKGIAWSGGGRAIIRVDVSIDGGKTWHVADIVEGAEQRQARAWAWVFWEATIELPGNQQNQTLEVCCSAVDVANNGQPPTFDQIWNVRGFLPNAWPRIQVKVPFK